MSARKTMKTFFAAMNEQVGMGGYGSKIKSTPMGPFRWNDLIQLWENVNNGMVMNNVSFQDMFMMGYDADSGDNGTSANFNPTLIPTGWGNANGGDTGNTVYWASDSGATITAPGNRVVFSNLSGPITVTLTLGGTFGQNPSNIKYKTDDGAPKTYATPITISNNEGLSVGYTTPNLLSASGSGTIIVTNTTTGTVLANISYGFSFEEL
jgi:hypothetical protein